MTDLFAPRADVRNYVGLAFDDFSPDAFVSLMGRRTAADAFAFLVTPNVDHVVRLHDESYRHRESFAAACRAARWRLCDSRILAALARLRGVRLRAFPGSDLTARLFAETVKPTDAICFVGGDQAIADSLKRRFPGITLHHHVPPMGLADNRAALQEAARFIVLSKARFTFIAVGSPQQELIAQLVAQDERATGTAFCVGAAIAFLTGHSRRAPRWMQLLGLEWLDRLLSEPRRLWRRYLVEGPRIFSIALSSDAVKNA